MGMEEVEELIGWRKPCPLHCHQLLVLCEVLGKANNTGSPNLAIYHLKKAFCGIIKHALEIALKFTDLFLFCLRGRAVWVVEVVGNGHFLGFGCILFSFHFGMLITHDERVYLRSSVSEKALLPCLFSIGCLRLGNKTWLTPDIQEKASCSWRRRGGRNLGKRRILKRVNV